jgi:hypothetical protein
MHLLEDYTDVFQVHVTNIVQCYPMYSTKHLVPSRVEAFRNQYSKTSAKTAYLAFYLDPTMPPDKNITAAHIRSWQRWVNTMTEDGVKSLQEAVYPLFKMPHDELVEKYNMPDSLYLTAFAGQHSSLGAKLKWQDTVVSKEARAGKRLPNVRANQNKIFAARDCLIFHTAGTYGKGQHETFPDITLEDVHKLGMYNNKSDDFNAFRQQMAYMLDFWIACKRQYEGKDLRKGPARIK